MSKPKRGVSLRIRWTWSLLLTMFLATVACGGAGCAKSAKGAIHATRSVAPETMSASSDIEVNEMMASGDDAAAPSPPARVSGAASDDNVSIDYLDQIGETGAFQKKAQRPTNATETSPNRTSQDTAIASDAVPISQVLIYTAHLTMAVFEVEKALNDVESLARTLGGFMARRRDTEITIRVPVAQFDDALTGIASKGDMLTRDVQVQDVTEEFLDVTLRLRNARQVRERIVQLLANAKNVKESILVERELNRLSGEIERLEGRIKYLRNRARYSTITVRFRPEQVDDVPNQAFHLPFPWLQDLGLSRLMSLQ